MRKSFTITLTSIFLIAIACSFSSCAHKQINNADSLNQRIDYLEKNMELAQRQNLALLQAQREMFRLCLIAFVMAAAIVVIVVWFGYFKLLKRRRLEE